MARIQVFGPMPAEIWSWSRAVVLQRCPQEYRYRYLIAYGGWRPEASTESRRLYRLAARASANNHLRFALQPFAEAYARAVLNGKRRPDHVVVRTCAPAGARREQLVLAVSDLLGAAPPSAVDRARPGEGLADRAQRAGRYLLTRDLWQRLEPPRVRRARVGVGTLRWYMDDMHARVTPDLEYEDEHGQRVIVDWTCSRTSAAESRLRLAVQAVVLQRAWHLRPAEAVGRARCIDPVGEWEQEHTLGAAHLAEAEAWIRDTAAQMRGIASAGPAVLDGPESPEACRSCCFRESCPARSVAQES